MPDHYTDEFATLLTYPFDLGRFTINKPWRNISKESLDRFVETKEELIQTNGFGSIQGLIRNVSIP